MNNPAPSQALSILERPLRPRNVPPRPADAPPVVGWRNRELRGRAPRIGAAPMVVQTGAPGAREETRAYAERIRSAWRAFFAQDVSPWAKQHFDATIPPDGTGPGGIVIGDVIGSDPAKVKAQKARAELLDRLLSHRQKFEAFVEAIGSFSIGGPSPAEAWTTLEGWEATLKSDRTDLAADRGPLKSDDPGKLDEAGGINAAASSIAGAVKTAGVAAVALGGLYVVGKVLGK